MENLQKNKNLLNNSKYFRLIGDKGYITKDKYKINNKSAHIITKTRVNSKIKQTKYNKTIINKNRYKIENIFALIKSFDRINLRKEKNIDMYYSFFYIACSLHNIIIDNNN